MGKFDRTRIPQRMSQHIMQLKQPIVISVLLIHLTNRFDMFILRQIRFVKRFLFLHSKLQVIQNLRSQGSQRSASAGKTVEFAIVGI